MKKYTNNHIIAKASKNKYTKDEIDAAFEYYNRKVRNCHPPGEFDRAGRFYADERTEHVESVRNPSGRYPYSELTAARTAEHCAQLFNVTPLHVKRIYKVIKDVVLYEGRQDRQADIISKMKRSTYVQLEAPKRERSVNLQITKPQPRAAIISKKKPFNPLREVSLLGFKPMKLTDKNERAEIVSAYKVDAGYIILSSQDNRSLTLSSDLSLSFVVDLHNQGRKVICGDCRAMDKEKFRQTVSDAMGQYSSSRTISL